MAGSNTATGAVQPQEVGNGFRPAAALDPAGYGAPRQALLKQSGETFGNPYQPSGNMQGQAALPTGWNPTADGAYQLPQTGAVGRERVGESPYARVGTAGASWGRNGQSTGQASPNWLTTPTTFTPPLPGQTVAQPDFGPTPPPAASTPAAPPSTAPVSAASQPGFNQATYDAYASNPVFQQQMQAYIQQQQYQQALQGAIWQMMSQWGQPTVPTYTAPSGQQGYSPLAMNQMWGMNPYLMFALMQSMYGGQGY